MSLADDIMQGDREVILRDILSYDTDPTKSDEDLAQENKCRVSYEGASCILDVNKADYSGFSAKRDSVIKDYLKNHTTIMYSYSGIAGTEPDPLVVFTGEITGFTYSLPQYFSGQTDLATHLSMLLNSAIIQDKARQVQGMFTFSPIVIPSIPTVSDYKTNCTVLDTTITSYVQTAINTVPTIGVHGIFTGPAIMTGIVIS